MCLNVIIKQEHKRIPESKAKIGYKLFRKTPEGRLIGIFNMSYDFFRTNNRANRTRLKLMSFSKVTGSYSSGFHIWTNRKTAIKNLRHFKSSIMSLRTGVVVLYKVKYWGRVTIGKNRICDGRTDISIPLRCDVAECMDILEEIKIFI